MKKHTANQSPPGSSSSDAMLPPSSGPIRTHSEGSSGGKSKDAPQGNHGAAGQNGSPTGGRKPTKPTNSCAECRRLKLKCSRKWPCDNCEKRGCAQICPTGEMVTGRGKRSILAGTEALHIRIGELEAALGQLHAQQSSDPHPLLADSYTFIPRSTFDASGLGGNGRPRTAANDRNARRVGEDSNEEVVESAFGTLTIGMEGQSRFVGSLAGSEYLREEDMSSPDDRGLSSPPGLTARRPEYASNGQQHSSSDGNMQSGPLGTPPPTAGFPGGFPVRPGTVSAQGGHMGAASECDHRHAAGIRATYGEGGIAIADSFIAGGSGIFDLEALRDQLPNWEREGKDLAQAYWDNVNWMYQIIPRPIFDQEYLPNAYAPHALPNPHKLAVVYLVMAIGTMFDLTRQPFDPNGERLFLLGRACLNIVGLEHSSPATVQALLLCGTYILNDKHGNGAEIFWPILGSIVKTAQSLGLHRDGEAFGLSPQEAEERRLLWWEVVVRLAERESRHLLSFLRTYDRLQALCFGRPSAVTNRTMDTQIPVDGMFAADRDGFHRAKFRLISMYEKVIDIQTQVEPVTYSTIQQLDDELAAFKKSLPEALLPLVPINELPLDRLIHPHLIIHRFIIRLLIAQTRLLLNRPTFSKALKDSPEDPSVSKPGGTSFVALYESAQEIVQLVKQLVVYHPSLIARWWFAWFHAFSAAVCLSAIAIQCPSSAFANPAYNGMTIVCDIAAAAREGCRAKKGLPILLRLRRRAANALGSWRQGQARAARGSVSGDSADSSGIHGDEDDLSHLASGAKLRRVLSSPPAAGRSLQVGLGGSTPPSASTANVAIPFAPHASGQQGHVTPVTSTIALANMADTPSERSGHTVATSVTLADPPYEGAVPRFPGSAGSGTGAPEGYNPARYPASFAFTPYTAPDANSAYQQQGHGPAGPAAVSPSVWLNHVEPSTGSTVVSNLPWMMDSGSSPPPPMSRDSDYGRSHQHHHPSSGHQYTSLGLHPNGRDDGDADTMMGDNMGYANYTDLSRLSAPAQRPPRRVSFSLDHEQPEPTQGQRAAQPRGFPKIERDAPNDGQAWAHVQQVQHDQAAARMYGGAGPSDLSMVDMDMSIALGIQAPAGANLGGGFGAAMMFSQGASGQGMGGGQGMAGGSTSAMGFSGGLPSDQVPGMLNPFEMCVEGEWDLDAFLTGLEGGS